jgi:uncharacterized repeat protein (TIGR04052 family)
MKMLLRKHGISALLAALMMSLAGCDSVDFGSRQPGEIPVKMVGIDTGACPMIMHVGQQGWNIDYFGFYLSNPEMKIDGRWQRVKFKQTQWQTQNVALLKFHSLCQSPAEANDKILLDVSDAFLKLSTSLRFTLGLPFDINHANPLTQPSPLNDSSMFWSWQNGHKFLRLDLSKNGGESRKWSYHLGSVGCESESAVRPPEKSCAFTNRVEFVLPMVQLDSELDLEVSLADIITKVDIDEAPNCMFETPDSEPCERLIQNVVNRPWIKWQSVVF